MKEKILIEQLIINIDFCDGWMFSFTLDYWEWWSMIIVFEFDSIVVKVEFEKLILVKMSLK